MSTSSSINPRIKHKLRIANKKKLNDKKIYANS